MIRGQKYRFNNTTGSSHPFRFRVSSGGSTYSSGVSGSENGIQFFMVPLDAPAQLVYQCTIHGGMVGNIYISGGSPITNGIDFSAQTTSSATGVVVQSEKITHFEEGIYVPYVQCSTSGTITLDTSYNKLSYTRINDTVTVHGRIRVSAVSSPSGQQLRVGLPFTSDVLTGNGDAGRVFGYARLENAAQHQYYYGVGATNGGNNYVQIHRIDENSDNPANVCADVDSNTRISVSFTFRAQ